MLAPLPVAREIVSETHRIILQDGGDMYLHTFVFLVRSSHFHSFKPSSPPPHTRWLLMSARQYRAPEDTTVVTGENHEKVQLHVAIVK